MKLILFGPPGAGKGTQAEFLSQTFSIPSISTGAIIRNAIREKTPMGIAAEKYIDEGQLVPDEVVIEIVKERISEDDCKNGYILDGFPRTLNQAVALKNMGEKIDHVIDLEVSDEDLIKRLSGRRECKSCGAPYHIKYNPPKVDGVCDKCGGTLISREDDDPETVRKRLVVYHKQTEPLKEFYKKEGLLRIVKGQEELADTKKEVLKALEVGK
ncbi:MAG: adenylate kinase [Clostridiaceae bacterium]|nr:adenylate kinase [Clostridiaceae bacterium]